MGTRSIIARQNPSGVGWTGRYCHWDGYPEGVGETLVTALMMRTAADRHLLMRRLIDETPQGWSVIAGADLSLPAVNMRKRSPGEETRAPQSYDPSEGSYTYTEADEPGTSGTEYLYIVAADMSYLVMYECRYVAGKHDGARMVGMFGMGAPDIGEGRNVRWCEIRRVSFEVSQATA